jgi:hypothetical protein
LQISTKCLIDGWALSSSNPRSACRSARSGESTISSVHAAASSAQVRSRMCSDAPGLSGIPRTPRGQRQTDLRWSPPSTR